MKNIWRVDYFGNDNKWHPGIGQTRRCAAGYMGMLAKMGITLIFWGRADDGLHFSSNLHRFKVVP